MSDASLWIFGYGSLVWRPAFPHLRSCPAFIDGYARRFWQGSTDHRGVPGAPGRVVTLLPDQNESLGMDPHFAPGSCWGTAYELPRADPEGVLAGLDHRERGGYARIELAITLWESDARRSRLAIDSDPERRPNRAEGLEGVEGVVYVASPSNENYLGPASLAEIAHQVAHATGPSGPNPEYVFELARSLRAMDAVDDHVFALESALHRLLGKEGVLSNSERPVSGR